MLDLDPLATAFDALPFGAVLLAEDSTAVAFNAYEEQRSGVTRNEVIGRPYFERFAGCFSAGGLETHFAEAVGRRPIDRDVRLRLPAPPMPRVRDVRVVLRDLQLGGLFHGLLLIQDLDHPRAAEVVKDHLTRKLAHDLASPTMVLTGALELVELAEEEGERQELMIESRQAAARLTEMHELLGAVARLDGEGGATVFGQADLTPLVDAAVESAGTTAEAKGVELQSVSPVQAVSAPVSRPQLELGLRELLEHALHSAETGSTVAVSLAAKAGEATIEIHAPGIAVPPSRLASPLPPPGDGSPPLRSAGLAVADLVARTHGGTLELGAAPQGGTLFTLRLPRESARRRRDA